MKSYAGIPLPEYDSSRPCRSLGGGRGPAPGPHPDLSPAAALTAAAQVGSLVRVPVGRRLVTGYLLGPTVEAPPGTLRDIREVLDPIPRFGPELVPLFRWVADYYQYPLGEALSFHHPGGAPAAKPRRELWACPVDRPERDQSLKRLGVKSRALLAYLQEAGPTPVKDLQARFPACRRQPSAPGRPGLDRARRPHPSPDPRG